MKILLFWFLGLVVLISCVFLGCCSFGLSIAYPSDWLERHVLEMIVICKVER